MSDKPEADAFDDGDEADADEVVGAAEDLDLDRVNKDLELSRRRDHKVGTPAWRRLEQLREERRTAELLHDIADFDIGIDDEGGRTRRARRSATQH